MKWRMLALACVVAMRPLVAQQDVCLPSADSHEAKTFAALSIPIAFSASKAPARAHGMSFGIEVAALPEIDSITSLPTTCRPDKKNENTHPIAGILRPRISIGIAGFELEASWIPPVRINGVSASLVGIAAGRTFSLHSDWYAGARIHAVFGSLHGPITCDEKAIADPTSECFHGTLSDDTWRPGVSGAEVVVGRGAGNFRPYAGVGYTMLRPRFQVNFTNAQGSTDRRQVNVDLNRMALFGGITWDVGRSSVTAEAYSTPVDAVTARLVVRTQVLR